MGRTFGRTVYLLAAGLAACTPRLEDATTVVPPGCIARLDDWSNIVIEVGT